MENGAKTRYYVLFTQTLKQWDVTETIRKTLPKGKGTVFYPCVELWMGSLGQTVLEPLFPGYVFIRSDMDQYEMHDFIRDRRREVLSFIKELRISEGRIAGEAAAVDGGEALTDLNEEETALLDFMLEFGMEEKAGTGHSAAGETSCFREDMKDGMEAPNAESEKPENGVAPGKRIRHRKQPSTGVWSMSYGYKETNGRYVVVEGPLKGHEDYILDVNPRDRRAYLNLKVGGRLARVGLTLRGKKYWFPADKASPDMLGDGTVVSCHEIAAAMMGSAKRISKPAAEFHSASTQSKKF